ncbi:heat shock 70 kDa protein 12B-like [Magallana gigas]|uniref:heat shock 70 kDa protein 12B-like n=1 Tax=Magallana gigas TaxID=29159 RepID=UPI003342243E
MDDTKFCLLVAAIDFGTSSSGCAFSFRHCYKEDPLDIHFIEKWMGDDDYHIFFSKKPPTCVLLNPQKEFLSFGYEAEQKYSELAFGSNHYDHYFFKEFKMVLHETRKLSRTIMIKDVKGKEVPALDLFAHVIRYLKDNLLSALESRKTSIIHRDIHWVLTVPDLWWKNSAKQFMREAAIKAGILTEYLTICLEPEAALTYCQRLPATAFIGNPGTQSFLSSSSETKFMIINLGGTTASININQKQSNGTFYELHIPTGGPWGGNKVNEALERMIIKIVGASCFQIFKDDHKTEYIEMQRRLEIKKGTVKPDSISKITIRISSIIHTLFKEETGENIKDVIQQMQLSKKITWLGDFLRIDSDLFKDLFREPVNMLVEHIQQLMTEDNLSDVSTLLMVGGFSESPIVLDAIMKAFPDKRVIVPEEARLAVLQGAVLFGHESDADLGSNPPGLL